jgi:hypothetical protein
MSLLVKFMVAILLLAIVATLVSQGSATTDLIQTASSVFTRLLGIVVSPIGGTGNANSSSAPH